MRFGAWVKLQRRLRHTPLPVMAQAIGMSKGGLSDLENHGKDPRYSSIEKIARYFNMEPWEALRAASLEPDREPRKPIGLDWKPRNPGTQDA